MQDKKSRYSIFGSTELLKRGVATKTSVGATRFDEFCKNLLPVSEGKIGKIPLGFEHRPDKISNLFYNTPGFWWMILMVNNITDPFDSLNVGDEIFIPNTFYYG